MRHFVIARQQYLIDPTHARSVQARTVLITGIPSRYLSEESLRKMYSHLPGGICLCLTLCFISLSYRSVVLGVKTIWINRFVQSHYLTFFLAQEGSEISTIYPASFNAVKTLAANLRARRLTSCEQPPNCN
jgi:hypothetical protein